MQTRDVSWWPKVSAWEGCGADFGCWTPMCERWFQKRLEGIRSGEKRPCSSKDWSRNLKFGKHAREFYTKGKIIGRTFLIDGCKVRPA